ncbi:MAG: hypothetical protein U5L45_22705 [Saprospiraceae bacterium]|nr:hypothetical protein [Saprospiraceae bacterium]
MVRFSASPKNERRLLPFARAKRAIKIKSENLLYTQLLRHTLALRAKVYSDCNYCTLFSGVIFLLAKKSDSTHK